MKTLLEIGRKYRHLADLCAKAGAHSKETEHHETALALKEAQTKIDQLTMGSRSLQNRDAFLSNQNKCLRDEVRMLRDEIKVNRGKNEKLMRALDEVAPFKWEYTPDGELKFRKGYQPSQADFSQIEGRLIYRGISTGRMSPGPATVRRSKFEVGQLVNVVRGGFYLNRVRIEEVIFFVPEAPNGILGANAPVEGEEMGVKYIVSESTVPGYFRGRVVWAWMLERAT